MILPCVIGCQVQPCPAGRRCYLRGCDDAVSLLEAEHQRQTGRVLDMLHEQGRPDLAGKLEAKLRAIALGIHGAASTWDSLTGTQREALEAFGCGKPIRRALATMRALARRGLIAWDGGSFTPEASAVITERGRFVLDRGKP